MCQELPEKRLTERTLPPTMRSLRLSLWLVVPQTRVVGIGSTSIPKHVPSPAS